MKKWEDAMVEELSIDMTADGSAPNDNFDDTWVQINGLWYKPGSGNNSSNK